MMEFPNNLLVDVMAGIGDDPSHEVNILVLDVLTKHPSEVPFNWRVLQKNSRSGRYMHVEISST